MSDQLQSDIACAIARIEQAYAERGTPLGEILLERLQGDARRLRAHLTPEWRSYLEAADQPEPGCPSCRTILNAQRAGCDNPWHADNRPAEQPEPHVPEGQALGVTDEQRTDPSKAEGDVLDLFRAIQAPFAGEADLEAGEPR